MSGNEIQIGSANLGVSESSSATSLTLYSTTDRTETVSHTYSTSLVPQANLSVNPSVQYTSSDTYDDDYTKFTGKYLKSSNIWYKIKNNPTRTAGNKSVVQGTASSKIIGRVSCFSETAVITYYDSVTAGDVGLVKSGQHILTANKNTDFSVLLGKYIELNNVLYQVPSSATITTPYAVIGEALSESTDSYVWWFHVGADGYMYWGNNLNADNYKLGTDFTKSAWAYDSDGKGYKADGVISQFTKSELLTYLSGNQTYFKHVAAAYNPLRYEKLINAQDYDTNLVVCHYQIVEKVPYYEYSITVSSVIPLSWSADTFTVIANGYAVSASYSEPQFTFHNGEIREITGEKCVNLAGDELSIDTLTPVVEYSFEECLTFKPTDYDGIETSDGLVMCGHYNINPRDIAYGALVKYYRDNNLIGTYYNKNVERIARNKYRINAQSLIGMLDMQYHKGGVYVNQTFQSIISEILGNMSITVEPSVAGVTLTGWLPYDTCRNNLHQLLFATNAMLLRSDSGEMVFTYLLTNDSTEDIPDSRIFDDGQVEYSTPCSTLELTEHTYEAITTVDSITLFDNTESAAVTSKRIIFDSAPIIPSTFAFTGTLTASEYNCNYAIVTGQGTMTGVPYTHITYTVTKTNTDATDTRVVTCTDATLVSTLNSENVANRLLSYYKSARTIKNGILLNNERCGTRYKLKDAFGDEATAYLSKISYNVTSIMKGDCELIADYVPASVGNNYTSFQLLTIDDADATTRNGTWTAPKTGTIKVALIGGGNGGESGYAGANTVMEGFGYADPSDGGDGGEPGIKGNGGYIYSFELSVTQGQQISFHIGAGSSGGAECSSHTTNNKPTTEATYQAGDGATTFGSYSSATGGAVSTGVMNIFNGAVYGLPGKSAVGGARGGNGGYRNTASETWDGHDGEDVTYDGITYHGGSGGLGTQHLVLNEYGYTGGSGGGGAAVNTNGGNGNSATGDTYVEKQTTIGESGEGTAYEFTTYCTTATPGKGANGMSGNDATIIGGGGSAGFGGGGEGGFAGVCDDPIVSVDDSPWMKAEWRLIMLGNGGETNGAGKGGAGGSGQSGGILIYI